MVQQDGKKRERSPEYPSFDLEEAVGKASALYQAERRNSAPIASVLEHWGYSPKSGGGQRAVSTLEKFGLVTAESSGENRKIRLTEAGFKIIIDERPGSSERLRLIQEAALAPIAHGELWKRYERDLPSDSTLAYELRARGFTPQAAADLIREYRSTIHFAQLDQDGILAEEAGDKPPAPPPPPGDGRGQSQQRRQGMTVLSLQVSDRLVELATPGGPLTKAEIGILRKYLEVQELIAPNKREEPPPTTGGNPESA